MSERDDLFEHARAWVTTNKERLVGSSLADARAAVEAAAFGVRVRRPRVQHTMVRRANRVVLVVDADDVVRDVLASQRGSLRRALRSRS